MPWKFKVTETKTEVSNDSRASANFLTFFQLRQDLPENHDELPIVSTTNECTLVENRAMETNSRAAVRGLILILPSLSDTHLHQGTSSA